MPLESLRAGPLTMLYEPASGFVRRICLGEREVLRAIYAAVRDRNWDTVPPTLRETRRDVREDSFAIEFECEHRQGDMHFTWRGAIRGEADGAMRYDFDGEAMSRFLRNRIGFCVLHPIRECPGARARQTRSDGTVIECRFPDLIEPQIFGRASFRDLRAVAHEVAPGTWAEVAFEGEVFEMEDQRNWTDASFKTYCTPLALPFPVEVNAGERVRQSVTLRLSELPLSGRPQSSPREEGAATTGRSPLLGLGVASHGEPLTETEAEQLRSLQLAHLRVDLRLGDAAWQDTFMRASQDAAALGVALELAVHLPKRGIPDLADLRRVLSRSEVSISRILALRDGEAATTSRTFDFIRGELGPLGAPIGAGSDCNFCELNREHALGKFPLAEADFVFWSINPQVHAFDDLSVMETIEAQAHTVRTARAFADGRPLVISPVTLRQRFNPVATGPATLVPPGDLPPQVDPRQLTEFAAEWTRASLRALTGAGVESVTYFETTGWRGVMERERGSPLPQKFPSRPGQPFPVFRALVERFCAT